MRMSLQQGPGAITWRQIVAELPFIPALSNWIKLLLSLLAEPLMFFSSLYIIAETVIPGGLASTIDKVVAGRHVLQTTPGWSPAILDNGTKTVMSLAPEIILPGCFIQAQIARRNGNRARSNLLYAICVLFVLLTLVTFASFVWNFAGVVGNAILFVRCAAGIGYTIILNVAAGESQQVAPTAPASGPAQPSPALPTIDYAEIARQVAGVLPAPAQQIAPVSSPTIDYDELAARIAPLVAAQIAPAPAAIDASILRRVIVEEIKPAVLATLPAIAAPVAPAGQLFKRPARRDREESPTSPALPVVEALARKPKPSRDELDRAILDHPDLSARKIAAALADLGYEISHATVATRRRELLPASGDQVETVEE